MCAQITRKVPELRVCGRHVVLRCGVAGLSPRLQSKAMHGEGTGVRPRQLQRECMMHATQGFSNMAVKPRVKIYTIRKIRIMSSTETSARECSTTFARDVVIEAA